MEGYDVVLIASFYGHPAFLKKFGVPGPEGKNIIPAAWQSGLGNGSSAGGIIGLLINGWASERFGPRKTFLIAMVLMIAAIFVPVFAQSLPVLTFGEVLCGIPWGKCSVVECMLPVLTNGHFRRYLPNFDHCLRF
jgi:SP family general alpha glucoside:H+ symporter-like MFS transporter